MPRLRVPSLVVAALLLVAACGGTDAGKTPAGAAQRAAPPAAGPYSFYINLAMDESVTCGTPQCDVPHLPRWILYLRGDLQVTKEGDVTGEGIARVVEIGRCATLLPRQSSCDVEVASDGRFTIGGNRTAAGLRITLTPGESPKVKMAHRLKSSSGPIEVPFDATYDALIPGVLRTAGVLGTPFDVVVPPGAKVSGPQPAHVFEGTFEQPLKNGAATYKVHAFGSWYFIDAKTAVPERAIPR